MAHPLHHRAFAVTVGWTLLLLFLGSVVHATGSSLACPDWPTCFGTLVPEMEGGVFWEHLHRLVAGGLVLMFAVAVWLAHQGVPREQGWVIRASWAGLALLLVQAVFGGLTVLWKLPDIVSTTHLALAFLFLTLAVALAAATSPRRSVRGTLDAGTRRLLDRPAIIVAELVFMQSLLGAWVRHTDAGMACGRGILCNGGLLPPAWSSFVVAHFLHRIVGIATLGALVWLTVPLLKAGRPTHVRRAAGLALALGVAQVVLGFLSAASILAVAPVSLHTLGAASLLAVTVLLAAWGRLGSPEEPGEALARSPEEAEAASGAP